MKDKRGFTLIEVLVSIAIMGILLIITLPQVNKIRQDNKTKKYETYENSIERAAKLYIDSNSKDLFGYYTSGCYQVSYGELKKANLIKDFSEKDITCDNSYTYVNVTKTNDEYHYMSNLVCKDKSGKLVYGTEQSIGCVTEEDKDAPQISITPDLDWKNVKDVNNITIKVSDDQALKPGLGLNKNISVKYQWVKQGSTINNNNWKTINFGNSKYQHTVKKVLKTKNLPTESGVYTLYVMPVSVMDVVGNSTTTEVFHQYKFDNTNPTANLSKSGDTISISASDSHSGLKSYYFGTKACNTLSNTDYISATSLNTSVKKYDGKTYYLCVKDKADNKKETSIKAYTECSSTNTGSWTDTTGCIGACGTGKKTQEKKLTDKYTNKLCKTETQEVSCSTGIDCCSKTESYDCSDWSWTACTKDCGGGTKYQKRTCKLRSALNHTTTCQGTKTEKRKENTACNTDPCLTAVVHGRWQCGSCKDTCSSAQVCPEGSGKIGNVVGHITQNKIEEKSNSFEVTLNWKIYQGSQTWIAKSFWVKIKCPSCSSNKSDTIKNTDSKWGEGTTHEGTYKVTVPKSKGQYKIEIEGNSDDPSFNMSFNNVIEVK